MNSSIYALFVKAGQIVIPYLLKEIQFSAILFGVIFVLTALFKMRSPHWQLGLWALVLIRLVLPPDLSFSYSGRSLIDRIPLTQAYALFNHLLNDTDPAFKAETNFTEFAFDENFEPAPIAPQELSIHKERRFPWQALTFSLWILGVIVFSLIYLKQRLKYYSLARKTSRVTDAAANEILREWRFRFGIRRSIRLVSSDRNLSPFTIGIFRPLIYLPQTMLESGSADLLQSVIAHEIAHIKRFDDLWIQLQNLIQLIYFFNPVVWIVNKKICLARECICDGMVLSKNKISAATYGHGIMAVLKLNLFGSHGLGLLPGFGSQRKNLSVRIKNLKGGYLVKKQQLILGYLFMIVLGMFFLPMGGCETQDQNKIPEVKIIQNTDKQSQLITTDRNESSTFMLPIREGVIAARFGMRLDPHNIKRVTLQSGIDIKASSGTEIYAIADGTVLKAKTDYLINKGYGRMIILEHANNFKTRYAHLSKVLVKAGKTVKAGDLIGRVGDTGRAAEPHLH